MSIKLIKEITLNCDITYNNPKITVKQGNNLSNVILVNVVNGDNIISLKDYKIKYVIQRADGTQRLSDADIEDNKIKIELNYNDISTAGTVGCEIVLSENEIVVYSSTFYITVVPNALDEDRVKHSDEYTSIINIIDKADNILDDLPQLENQVTQNEETRCNNENIRQENESERQTSFSQIEKNSTAIINENTVQVENAKKQAQYAKVQGDYAKVQADRIADSDVSHLQQSIDDINYNINDLKGYVGYVDRDIYGVEIDFKNNIFTRLAGARDLQEGEDFDKINAYNRRRCILNDNGDVVCYYGDDNYIEDGSLGQVMVEQPKFYYKVVPLELNRIANGEGYHLRKARYYISNTMKQGFKVHPVFIKNGVEKDKIYLSAYEGCIYDTSAETYLKADEQVADFSTDKLSSIADAKPCSGKEQQLTRANSRKLANNRGEGYEISTIQSISATQLLFLIEYAGFNIQEKIANGIVNISDDGITNMSIITGKTSSLGNASGVGENNSVTYRGEENLYGNIFKWIDGINIYNYNIGEIYVSDCNFKDDTKESNYKKIGISIPAENGYVSAFGYNEEFDWIFIPSEVSGNSLFPVGDMFYQNRKSYKWTVCTFGGYWKNNSLAGAYYLYMYDPSSGKGRFINSRLVFI